MDYYKLKEGEEVNLNVPFTYTIGDMGYHTGKILETVQDCKNELIEELKLIDTYNLVIEEIKKD